MVLPGRPPVYPRFKIDITSNLTSDEGRQTQNILASYTEWPRDGTGTTKRVRIQASKQFRVRFSYTADLFAPEIWPSRPNSSRHLAITTHRRVLDESLPRYISRKHCVSLDDSNSHVGDREQPRMILLKNSTFISASAQHYGDGSRKPEGSEAPRLELVFEIDMVSDLDTCCDSFPLGWFRVVCETPAQYDRREGLDQCDRRRIETNLDCVSGGWLGSKVFSVDFDQTMWSGSLEQWLQQRKIGNEDSSTPSPPAELMNSSDVSARTSHETSSESDGAKDVPLPPSRCTSVVDSELEGHEEEDDNKEDDNDNSAKSSGPDDTPLPLV